VLNPPRPWLTIITLALVLCCLCGACWAYLGRM
jgi:hypothetical protein